MLQIRFPDGTVESFQLHAGPSGEVRLVQSCMSLDLRAILREGCTVESLDPDAEAKLVRRGLWPVAPQAR